MSNTKKLTFSAIMAAGAVLALLAARLIPTGEFALAAVASLFVAAAAIDCGAAWGLAAYAVSGGAALMLAPGAPTWLYVVFFGFYPVLKQIFEAGLPKVLGWAAKYLVLCASGVVLWWFLLDLDAGRLPLYAAGAAVVFAVYDVGYSRLIAFYKARISRKR
jgi:hypothetical protein